MPASPPLWSITLEAPLDDADAFEAALELFCAAVSRFESGESGRWRIEGFAMAAPDKAALAAALAVAAASRNLKQAPDFRLALVEEKDWVSASRRDQPPVRAGRFFIHGAHLEGAPPPGLIALRIDAGLAFGSGRHESTLGCLIALERLARARRFSSVLDLGCGSGVLALAAARLWRTRVLAVDIDPAAAAVARENVRGNGMSAFIRVLACDGFASPAVAGARPFDLIAANILADPIRRLVPALARHLRSGGVAVLAGFLGKEAPAVVSACRAQGLSLVDRILLGDWATLVFGRLSRLA